MEQPAEAAVQDVVRSREAPCFVLLDEHRRIVSADARVAKYCTREQLQHMIRSIEVDGIAAFRAVDEIVTLRAGMPDSVEKAFVPLLLERFRTRAPLSAAAQLFCLSDREVQVLHLILCGLEGRDIAERLNIAPATVREYFKHLAIKIGGHNRAEMIARVLDYRTE